MISYDDDSNLNIVDPDEPVLDETPLKGGLNFSHTNETGTSTYRIVQTAYDIFQIQRTGDTTGDGPLWSLIDLLSPTAADATQDSESTLSLTTRAGALPGNISRTLDIYNDEYSRDNGMGLRQLYKNTQPNPMRFELHDKSTSGGAFTLGEIYAVEDDTFFTSIDAEATGIAPTVDDWVWDNAGSTFADDTKITNVEPDTPSAGITTFYINRPIMANANPGTARGKCIKEIMRFDAERRMLVRKFIADHSDSVAEFGGNVYVDGDLIADNLPDLPGAWQTWVPTQTGFSIAPAGGIYRYRYVGDEVELEIRQPNDGTSNANTLTISLPVQAATVTDMVWQASCRIRNNGAFVNNPGYASISSGSSTLDVHISYGTTSWGTANGKRLDYLCMRYAV